MEVFLKWKIVRVALTCVYLMAGWLLFTGSLAPFSLLIGLIFSFCVALVTYGVFIEESEAARRSHLPQLYLVAVYILVLVFKIYASSFKVVFNLVRGDINPRIVHFRTRLKSDVARVLLANSISLTPGTVTLDLDEDHLIVHWLDAKTTHSHYAGKLIKGHFELWLRRIWM